MNPSLSWTFLDAITFIEKHDPYLRKHFGCFLGLTGGILYQPSPRKDLDLVILPMNMNEPGPNVEGALEYFRQMSEEFYKASWSSQREQAFTPLTFHCATINGKRVDFITQ